MNNRLIVCTAILLSSFAFCCGDVLAQCSLNLQSAVNSGWNKASVSYAIDKSTLKIKVADGSKDDADSIYIGSIKGCRTLTIDVAQISGKYPWDGKVIGFSFFNDKLDPHQWGSQASFPSPRGRAIEDGFVKPAPSSNTKLVYDIANPAGTTHIGAKVFIGSHNALELQFSVQEASRDLQSSAQGAPRDLQSSVRQPARSSKLYAARSGQQPDGAANSCALTCHEPRSSHREFAYARGFSIPSHDDCPDDGD